MKTQEQLIRYYEERLLKVKAIYEGEERKVKYIECAENDIKEVKNGRSW